MSNWKYILGLTSYAMLKYLLLDVDPRDIVLWDDNISSNLCDAGLMRVQPGLVVAGKGRLSGIWCMNTWQLKGYFTAERPILK